MRIRLLTITHKVPTWVKDGYEEYAKRLSSAMPLELIEIPAEKRNSSSTIAKIVSKEGARMLAAIKPNHRVIALDVTGEAWSTEQLTQQIKIWQQSGRTIDLLVGGPDGLAPECLDKAEKRWSLSPLTFPHALVRILVAEQLYRALSILQNHPYHK